MSASAGSAAFDFSGIPIRVRGLSDLLLRSLRGEWSGFLSEDSDEPWLDVVVRAGDEPEPSAPWDPKSMRARFREEVARYEMDEGTIELGRRGEARVDLRCGAGRRGFVALLNLFRAGLAWRMPSRGGVLLHAAALAVEGRAFLLVGSEGSGKSTWSGAGVAGGATLLGDDVVLVDRGPGGFEALAAPLRPGAEPLRRPARFPVAALLFPLHGAPARLGRVASLDVYGRVLANLPFLADTFGADDRIPAVIEDLRRSVPARALTFAPDASFLPLLASFSPEAS